MRKTLSVVIPVFNVEGIIRDCLSSVRWADEIVCVDMHSSDKTIKLCKDFGAVVIKNRPSNDNFDINRLLGMRKASSHWILKIDSDDRLTLKLQKSIKELLKENSSYEGYKIYNKVFFFNKEIKYGIKTHNSHELRLVRRNAWQYNPYKFHQLIKVKGDIGFLEGEYLHFNSQSIKEFVRKLNKYTSYDADKDFKRGKRINFLHVVLSPIYKFFKLFIFRKGFLDKTYGLIICTLYAFYNFAYKVKLWERKK